MLEELHIRGLGVIDDAVLALGPGLTVVTGETGAGKTMVVSGLLLLFGARADTARLRAGAEQASIDGRLVVADSAVVARVRDAGGDLDDATGLSLRRTVSATGRSRAYVGGSGAPIAVLAELADRLITVHGQSDQLKLTRRSEQLDAVDRFADIALERFEQAFARWRRASDSLSERHARSTELRIEADLLAHGLAEIEAVGPLPGEDAELDALASRLAHADGLRLAARAAHDALAGDADNPAADTDDAGALLGVARRALAGPSGADAVLDQLAVRVAEVGALVSDLAEELRTYAETLDADPIRLAVIEDRRSRLRTVIRKFGDQGEGTSAVLGWAARARERLVELDFSDEALDALRAECDDAAAAVVTEAAQLTAARSAAAATLSERVSAELSGLAMAGATLKVAVGPRAAGPAVYPVQGGGAIGADGADVVDFLLRAHPDAPLSAIGRSASGGELSRVMLALQVCLAGTDPVPTMVFDEVDAGVGGRAAVEVGRRLARLARDHQVIVVTHLAQVAAFADNHVVVDKSTVSEAGGVTASDVRVVTGKARIAELARMLAGTDTAAARDHAHELLTDAAADRVRTLLPRRSSGP
ncbi:MAG: DNA repair protein RecN [Actinomycetota bacterium]|nr:DNA repair protein RecN [Actinomycetota bacterium]